MRFIIKLILSAALVMLYSNILPFVKIDDWMTALFVVVVISILNVLLKPILVALTIPITIVTLGLFLLVINAIIIKVADYLIDGFTVEGFWGTILFSIILSLSNAIIDAVVDRDDKK